MDNKLQIQYNLHPATLERWEQIKTVMPYKFRLTYLCLVTQKSFLEWVSLLDG